MSRATRATPHAIPRLANTSVYRRRLAASSLENFFTRCFDIGWHLVSRPESALYLSEKPEAGQPLAEVRAFKRRQFEKNEHRIVHPRDAHRPSRSAGGHTAAPDGLGRCRFTNSEF